MKNASAERCFRPVAVAGSDDYRRFCAAHIFSAQTAAHVERQHPDAMWMLEDEAGNVAARCSLWWHATAVHEGRRAGLIGHYAAANRDAGARLLDLACRELDRHGCTLAAGPMDGNTWQSYRLVIERGTEPPFFLEPDHPDDWPDHFRSSGFSVLARYYSALCTDIERPDPGLAQAARRLEVHGVSIRPLRIAELDQELARIHALSLESFRDSFLFTPIGLDDFLPQYLALRDFVRPELVLMAEQGERLIGYIFALPNVLEQRADTIIIKTLAVHPEFHAQGLGRSLAGLCHQRAFALGYRRAIHALMLDTSAARGLSDRIATPIRRYALFGRRLGTPA
jgi:GNAT superfamily N-acetyltransferase